ncbi:MAG: hypothetical protein ACI8Y8_003055, partial [Planctomycetota bacterium]
SASFLGLEPAFELETSRYSASEAGLLIPSIRLIALITDTLVARHILRRLGLPGEAPPFAAARTPPQTAFEF